MAVAHLTRTLTINPAFLQEIKDVNQDLWKLVEETRHTCSNLALVRMHRRSLVGTMGKLRDQLAMHFALEEAYGYFEDPVFVAPRLSERAECLRSEHQSLYLDVCELVEFVEKLSHRGRMASLAGEFVHRFADFDERLMAHEDAENELILEAYDQDIGVGD